MNENKHLQKKILITSSYLICPLVIYMHICEIIRRNGSDQIRVNPSLTFISPARNSNGGGGCPNTESVYCQAQGQT